MSKDVLRSQPDPQGYALMEKRSSSQAGVSESQPHVLLTSLLDDRRQSREGSVSSWMGMRMGRLQLYHVCQRCPGAVPCHAMPCHPGCRTVMHCIFPERRWSAWIWRTKNESLQTLHRIIPALACGPQHGRATPSTIAAGTFH